MEAHSRDMRAKGRGTAFQLHCSCMQDRSTASAPGLQEGKKASGSWHLWLHDAKAKLKRAASGSGTAVA